MKATDDEPTAILPTRTVPSWTTVDDRVMGGVSRSSIEASGDGVAWQLGFATSAGEWTEVKLPFRDYTASYRGRRLPEMGPIEPGRIRQLGLMIADGQTGPFELEVAWIRGYSPEDGAGGGASGHPPR